MVQKFNAVYDQHYNKGATRTSVEITTSFFHLARGGLGCCKKKKGAGSWQALIVASSHRTRSLILPIFVARTIYLTLSQGFIPRSATSLTLWKHRARRSRIPLSRGSLFKTMRCVEKKLAHQSSNRLASSPPDVPRLRGQSAGKSAAFQRHPRSREHDSSDSVSRRDSCDASIKIKFARR